MQIKKLTPNLVVRNVEASLKFYREVLGLQQPDPLCPIRFPTFSDRNKRCRRSFFQRSESRGQRASKTRSQHWRQSHALYGSRCPATNSGASAEHGRKHLDARHRTVYGMREFAFEDVDGYTITIAEKMQ